MFPMGHSFKYTDLKIGQIAQKKIIAPFDFAVLKTEDELKKERQKAKDEIPYYFNYYDTIETVQINTFKEFLEKAQELAKVNKAIMELVGEYVN